jgi:hypothetical protein
MINTIIKHIRARWVFMVLFTSALAFLIMAEYAGSLVLAGIGALIAFVAGSEYGDHHICHNCAMDMVVADPEIPEHYPVA